MSEFTGERVIPHEVNDDLWAEHFARYAFARTLAAGKIVLDIGCGTGYGVAALAHDARYACGIDPARQPIDYARTHYRELGNARFVQASAIAIPFADHSFDLVTAFEVIEHLTEWPRLLAETRRLLKPAGFFLVSTPNKNYYAEARAESGPNPFHVHEFEYAEFCTALAETFPFVDVFFQNWASTLVFSPANPRHSDPETHLDVAAGEPENAHFYLALCSLEPIAAPGAFLYLPRAANVLREREHHIRILERDLARMTADRNSLIDLHDAQTHELEQSNRWARRLEQDWKAALDRVAQLQDELRVEQARGAEVADAYAHKVAELEEENRATAAWANEMGCRLAAKGDELAETVRLLDTAEATVVQRTQWAQRLQSSLDTLQAQLRMVQQSRWVRLGRVVGIGPRVEG